MTSVLSPKSGKQLQGTYRKDTRKTPSITVILLSIIKRHDVISS